MIIEMHSVQKSDKLKSMIEFKRIGKNSLAHNLAISISRNKKKPTGLFPI